MAGCGSCSAGEFEIGVIRHDGKYYAYRNYCPHQGGPACEGVRMPQVVDVIGENGIFLGKTFDETDMHIVCPWHGYEFHLSDGYHVCDSGSGCRNSRSSNATERSMSQSEQAAPSFETLASEIAATCAEAIDEDRLDDIPDDSLGPGLRQRRAGSMPPRRRRAGAAAVRPQQRRHRDRRGDRLHARMLEGVGLAVFELGAWQAMSAASAATPNEPRS